MAINPIGDHHFFKKISSLCMTCQVVEQLRILWGLGSPTFGEVMAWIEISLPPCSLWGCLLYSWNLLLLITRVLVLLIGGPFPCHPQEEGHQASFGSHTGHCKGGHSSAWKWENCTSGKGTCLTIRNHLKSKLEVAEICMHRTTTCSICASVFYEKNLIWGFVFFSKLADSEKDRQSKRTWNQLEPEFRREGAMKTSRKGQAVPEEVDGASATPVSKVRKFQDTFKLIAPWSFWHSRWTASM